MSAEHIEWNRNGLCGAACAQMALHARGVSGTTSVEQDAIWTSIKLLTGGNSTLECSGVNLDHFDSMIREACGRSRVVCWLTYPDALQAVLTARLGGGVTVAVKQTNTEAIANGRIKSCLGRGGLPIVLVNCGAHWVVVDEWNDNHAKPVRLLDPAHDEPTRLTVRYWNALFMGAVDCGVFDGNYVIVEVG